MSNINRCGTCRFWGKAEDASAYYFNLRPCLAVKQRDDIEVVKDAEGDPVEDADYNEIPVVPPKAMAVDGSNYYAALRTAEDFGCVLWDAKS